MRRLGLIVALFSAAIWAGPAEASTFASVTETCPVGGEKFTYSAQVSSSSWGQLPDGMRLGTGPNPYRFAQCPTNGLVMYRDFDQATIAKLTPLVMSAEYQSLRKTETPYYLAYWLARKLGDPDPAWLLLAAGWEAKNIDAASARARRYAKEFVALVAGLPADDTSFTSIALRARAANALRELGDFAAAEAMRASIKVSPRAGGNDPDAAANRTGWTTFLASLAPPIARGDPSRDPIDLIGDREAAKRCVDADSGSDAGHAKVRALTAFEATYCTRPELAEMIAKMRTWRSPR